MQPCRAVCLATLAVAGVVGACKSTYDETAAVDAGAVAAEAGPSDAGPPNALANGSFELGCAGWQGYNITSTESADGRSGKACLVCLTADYYSRLSQKVSLPLRAGDKYFAEIWYRAPPAVTWTKPLGLEISEYYDGGSLAGGATPSALPTQEWARVTALITAKAGDTLELIFHVAEEPTKCVLIDDAKLSRLP